MRLLCNFLESPLTISLFRFSGMHEHAQGINHDVDFFFIHCAMTKEGENFKDESSASLIICLVYLLLFFSTPLWSDD